MKHILFLIPALPGGGAEKVLVDTLHNFDYSKYKVSLFLEYREGVYLDDIPAEVEILYLHKSNNLWFQRLHRRLTERGLYGKFHEVIYRRQFLKLIGKRHFDTIVSFMEGSAVKFHSYIFDRAKKNVSWVHIDLKKKHWSLDFFKNAEDECNCYSIMDNIVFVSSDAKSKFLDLYPEINPNKCQILYNLIDKEDINSKVNTADIKKDKITICMVGRLNHQKRYDRAIEAASLLAKDGVDFQLWIIGTGELENDIKLQISEKGLYDKVLLKGFVKPPHSLVATSDIFLNTSESEGYPLTICEALTLGKPIVATAITGANEILGDSEFGVLVDEDSKSIYLGLKKLITDDSLLHQYEQKAIERSNMFNVKETMDKIYSIL